MTDSFRLKNLIIYEVFPRNHSPQGTLNQLRADIGRIKELGADIIWLMPVYPIGETAKKGQYGSPYAIRDYRKINPHLGSREDFKELVERAHQRDIQVMIDIVFNHTAADSHLIREHPDWYLLDDDGKFSRKVAEWDDIYDLDYSSSSLREYLIQTLENWARLGVDGFRCDVAPLVPLDFWAEARKRLNKIRDIIWLAESVEKSFIR
ncbi:MAG TPA: alpha-amylase family glycosyl hydrolase, partial [Halanaerobiales bacterium]|nr:alpha-amylase family glycosyl hydrolase [Halanaerobiales bacterium]